MIDYKVIRNADPPKARPGPKGRWHDLGLDAIAPRTKVTVRMGSKAARNAINSLRCHVRRISERTGKQFSVTLAPDGIAVYRKDLKP